MLDLARAIDPRRAGGAQGLNEEQDESLATELTRRSPRRALPSKARAPFRDATFTLRLVLRHGGTVTRRAGKHRPGFHGFWQGSIAAGGGA